MHNPNVHKNKTNFVYQSANNRCT